ncbi:hypothetical protein [Butyrivibrio proteoclasticus]|uniref:hypothetical protein n=1 Tax=Butyrivibrio proteoclasticus TaxID=43305 RepID=UPI00047E7459|nr:hypothetical protein [Butyrivibrio proteoclasticus]
MLVFIISALSLLVLAIYISKVNKVNIGDGLAVSASALILALYVLAFFRLMQFIWIPALACGFYAIYKMFQKRDVADNCGKDIDKNERNVNGITGTCLTKRLFYVNGFILGMFLLVTIVVSFLVSGNVFSWWDDINFWSSDAKQLFFMNGFPGKYGNVSPEFGDYPPVTSIFKWLFLQLGNGEYKEGLQFAGYFALNTVFLMPLAGRIVCSLYHGMSYSGSAPSDNAGVDKKRGAWFKCFVFLLMCLAFISVVVLPGVFNGIIYYGTPADITMGILYGTLLISIYEQDQCSQTFYYARIMLYTAVLLLTKSVGIEWAVFALIFYLMIAKKSVKMIWSVAGSAVFYGSWLVFCLIRRRVAKLTGAGIKMATSGTYTAPLNTSDKAGFFWEGLWTMPMHADRNITLDLPTGVMVLIIFALLISLVFLKVLDKKSGFRIFIFMLVTGLLTYGIIFLAHISIFQGEDQYLDAYAMAVSVARYGFPFAFGSFVLMIRAALGGERGCGLRESGDTRRTDGLQIQSCDGNSKSYGQLFVLGFMVFVLLTADYSGIYKHIWGYRQNAASLLQDSYDMVGDDGRIIVNAVLEDKSLWGKRVLVMRDGHTYHWVHDTYISKEASPVPLVYDAFLAESDDSAVMASKIMDKHASYLYVEDEAGVSADLFKPLLADGEEFSAGVIYKVIEQNGAVVLERSE